MYNSADVPSASPLHSYDDSLESVRSPCATASYAEHGKECDYGYFTFHQDEDTDFHHERLRLEQQAKIHYYREYASSTSSSDDVSSHQPDSVEERQSSRSEPPRYIYLKWQNGNSSLEDNDGDSYFVQRSQRRYMYALMMTFFIGSTLVVAATDATISAVVGGNVASETLLEYQFQDLRI